MAALTDREALAHLFRRAGFGVRPDELDAWAAKGLQATVDALVTPPPDPEQIDPPVWRQPFDPGKLLDQQSYWLHRMVVTRHPLVEKMTLFWHGHFATGVKKVRHVEMMTAQNRLMRRYALGSFPELLREMAKDAAMLIWLDGNNSNLRSPNENYAREVMELFTTGPGPYTETDVKQAARAFTGWHVDPTTYAVSFINKAHDSGSKTFLGETGPFGADEISKILAVRPETATFLSAKLWRFFASPSPDAETVSRMAEAYQSSQGSISEVLRVLFTSPAFYDAAVVQTQVKSPAEFVAGVLRTLRLPVGRDAAGAVSRMGQVLYDPPSVAGWPGGSAWLGASALLARINYGEAVKASLGPKPNEAWLDKATTPATLVDWWLSQFAVANVLATSHTALLDLAGRALPADRQQQWELTRNLIRTIIASPDFQAT